MAHAAWHPGPFAPLPQILMSALSIPQAQRCGAHVSATHIPGAWLFY
jgi:hypothetical protein